MRSNRGFTLIETLITTAIMVSGLVAVASMFSYSVTTNLTNQQRTAGTMLLYEKMEIFKATALANSIVECWRQPNSRLSRDRILRLCHYRSERRLDHEHVQYDCPLYADLAGYRNDSSASHYYRLRATFRRYPFPPGSGASNHFDDEFILMKRRTSGFSLIELMMAMVITLGIGMIVFQLFQQNEQVFRDQNLVMTAQQSARVVAAQIADEIRMAGQGVPVYSSTYDATATEGIAVFLSGTTSNRVEFRSTLSNTETNVTTAIPVDLTLGASGSITAANASLFSTQLGTTSPTGTYVYIWGPTTSDAWTWVRAQLTAINTGSNTLTITPSQAGEQGRSAGADATLNTSDDVIRFTKAPTVVLEQAVTFYLSSNTIKRATATSMTNQTSPTWTSGDNLGLEFTSLNFTYYDESDNVVTPSSLANRMTIARVDVQVVVRTADELSSTRSRNTYALSVRSLPRNARLR